MENEENEGSHFDILPDEAITVLLNYLDIQDVVNFGGTCKRFYELVIHNEYVWKEKYRKLFPEDIFNIVDDHADGKWLRELQRYHYIKKEIHREMMGFSEKIYWHYSHEITLDDVKPFFELATNSETSFYYTICILQDLMNTGRDKVGRRRLGEKPYTLTEMHYALEILRLLMYVYLPMKWVKAYVSEDMYPDRVVTFYLQWMDVGQLYSDEEVDATIQKAVKDVEAKVNCTDIPHKIKSGHIRERKVLEAISDLLFKDLKFTVNDRNLHGYDIVKAFTYRFCNVATIAAIYESLSRKCGVNCELVAFPNHFFLQWTDIRDPTGENTYTISLRDGSIVRKASCPFSWRENASKSYKYNPNLLLQHLATSHNRVLGRNITRWYTQCIAHLVSFLLNQGSNYPYVSEARKYFQYLLDVPAFNSCSEPVDMRNMSPFYRNIIWKLYHLTEPSKPQKRELVVKKHNSQVKYAVGMVCFHKKYQYTCIIRGWDLRCLASEEWISRMGVDSLAYGSKQPFYNVVAVDLSDRYVAQENLVEVKKPNRICNLEDLIATEFSHFDGFCYVPNEQKAREYPDEEPVREKYRLVAGVAESYGALLNRHLHDDDE